MRVLFIHNNYASNNSGEEHAALELVELLESNGHIVEWYRRSSDIIKKSLFKKINAFFTGFYNPRAVKELRLKLNAFQPDVVQIQNLYPFISPGIIRLIKKKGIPIVMRCPNYRLFCPTGLHLDPKGKVCEKCLSVGREIHCVTNNCEKNHFKSIGYAIRNFLARKIWGITNKMDAYIVQTHFQKQKFIKNGIQAEKLFIVPSLTSNIKIVEEIVEPTFISFIGRISEEKGINEFLEAAKKLPNIPFMVVGDFQNSIHLKENSSSNVLWKGFVVGRELEMMFKQSKIVVVPSKWYESFPNVILKAMMHGRAIITSNLGAMADIIEHGKNGVLVEPGNSEQLSIAIKDLYMDTEKCMSYGINARKKAVYSYSSSHAYNSLIKIYSGLLEKKSKQNKTVLKNILFILHFPPPVHGAAMVGQYIKDSKLINKTFHCNYINLSTSVKVDEIGKGGWVKLVRYLKILGQTLFSLYRDKPKLVYVTLTATGSGFYKDAVLVLLIKIFRKKVVVHFHNKGVSMRQGKLLDNFLYKLVFKNTRVILLSEFLYNDIKKYVPRENVYYCANGIPENKNHINEPNAKSDKRKVQILFLSNLIESKGVYVLLEACKILQLKGVPFQCKFIGGVADITVKDFEERVKFLELQNYAHYDGRKYGAEKEKAYAAADIFALPTHYSNECFPLVILEAMQFSLPIITTFEGGIPSIVEPNKTGFLIEQKDSLGLAAKLEQLIIDDELRLTMGENGRKRYEEQFSLEIFEKRFSNIINELV